MAKRNLSTMSSTSSSSSHSDDDTQTIIIAQPNKYDVLGGRGGETNNHYGNILFRSLVKDKKLLYKSLGRENKTLLAKSIVLAIQAMNPPGRFLVKQKQNKKMFVPITFQQAVDKTCQALREKSSNTPSQNEIKDIDEQGPNKRLRTMNDLPLPTSGINSSSNNEAHNDSPSDDDNIMSSDLNSMADGMPLSMSSSSNSLDESDSIIIDWTDDNSFESLENDIIDNTPFEFTVDDIDNILSMPSNDTVNHTENTDTSASDVLLPTHRILPVEPLSEDEMVRLMLGRD